MDANINIEVQVDNPDEGMFNVGEFLDLIERLNVQRDWSFRIEEDTCSYIRFHKNDEIV